MSTKRDIDVVVGEIFDAMPAALTREEKLLSLVASALRASGLTRGESMSGLAKVASAAHGGASAMVQIIDGRDSPQPNIVTYTHSAGFAAWLARDEGDNATALCTITGAPGEGLH